MTQKDLIISKLLELKKIYYANEDKKWNSRAISMAITALKKYDGPIISGTYLNNELKGIGDKISKRIDEILETGTLEELVSGFSPENTYLENMLSITGVGIVRAKKWVTLGIKDINDVKQAILDKKITTTHHIDIGIKYYEDLKLKIPRAEIDTLKNMISAILKIKFDICGSYRRGALESGDVDILISQNDGDLKKIVKKLQKNNIIIDSLTTEGSTKFMGIYRINDMSALAPAPAPARRIDIRLVSPDSYYAALLYFTGNKNFNIYLRQKAIDNGYTLNEYGLKFNDELRVLKSENEIFEILNISVIDPEKRT